MSRLDQLPPDQRAALSLLLRQRKSYADVAKLLGIPEHAVHDRAQVALAVLAPLQARDVTPDRRKEIGDYLLGQQPGVAERLRTRTLLSSSEPARAWASEVASQLAPLGDAGLPDIPPAAPAPQRLQDLSAATVAAGSPAGGPPPPPASAATRSPRSSRLGGAVLLGVILVAVVVAVVLLSGGSSGKKSKTTASKTSSTSTSTQPVVENQISLKPPAGTKSGSAGVVDVLGEGSARVFVIEAQHIPASKGFYYAIWLYNSPSDALALSKSPAIGATHRLAGDAPLPSDADKYHEILLTKETKAHPKRPGHVVLRGPFSLQG